MKAIITDSLFLKSLLPKQVLGYLEAKDAVKTREIEGKVAYLEYQGRELLVPLSTHFADYAHRISELLRELEEIEYRSQIDIAADIASGNIR